MFLIEASTVFLNEWFDFDSDRRNRNAGPFTGGSRVLVDGRLDRGHAQGHRHGAIAGAAAPLIALVLVGRPAASAQRDRRLYVLFAVLALVYTVPPLKFSHRGFGELDVALTHSAGAIMAGYVAQGGVGWTACHGCCRCR